MLDDEVEDEGDRRTRMGLLGLSTQGTGYDKTTACMTSLSFSLLSSDLMFTVDPVVIYLPINPLHPSLAWSFVHSSFFNS